MNGLLGKIIVEILILWVCYVLYMAILVHRRGPIGGIFFYPKAMQERTIALGLITAVELKRRRRFAMVLLLAWMLLVPLILIVFVNGARSYWDCCWQYYVLFLGAEFFDWLVIDTIWVALSDWWLIPGTEDLKPYIPRKMLIAKWLVVLVGNPILAACLSGIMLLFVR